LGISFRDFPPSPTVFAIRVCGSRLHPGVTHFISGARFPRPLFPGFAPASRQGALRQPSGGNLSERPLSPPSLFVSSCFLGFACFFPSCSPLRSNPSRTLPFSPRLEPAPLRLHHKEISARSFLAQSSQPHGSCWCQDSSATAPFSRKAAKLCPVERQIVRSGRGRSLGHSFSFPPNSAHRLATVHP